MKQFWINLPVKDVAVSKAFFRAIGFEPNHIHDANPHLGSFFIGEQKVVMMLFSEAELSRFAQHPIADTSVGAEILLNIDAQTREEVDEMANKVRAAGGTVYAEPAAVQGWMYALGFTDPDGHRWSMLHMDMAKMP